MEPSPAWGSLISGSPSQFSLRRGSSFWAARRPVSKSRVDTCRAQVGSPRSPGATSSCQTGGRGQSTARPADFRRHNLAICALVEAPPRCYEGDYSCSQLSPQTRYWSGSCGGSLWPSVGCLALGSWNGCSGWCGVGGLQKDASFETAPPNLAVSRTGRTERRASARYSADRSPR
jgi:hypothetical protein